MHTYDIIVYDFRIILLLTPFKVEVDVTLAFPEPSKSCKLQEATVPEVKCEDLVEVKCQDMPRVVEVPENIERCNVVVGEPKCEEVELVLPRQVCKDIIYGFREVPMEVEQPQPQQQQPQPQYGYQQQHYGQQPRYLQQPYTLAPQHGYVQPQGQQHPQRSYAQPQQPAQQSQSQYGLPTYG